MAAAIEGNHHAQHTLLAEQGLNDGRAGAVAQQRSQRMDATLRLRQNNLFVELYRVGDGWL
jgi:hypothetical protein